IGMPRRLETTNTVVDTKLIKPLGDSHVLTVRGQYRRAAMTDSPGPETYDRDTHALFAEAEWAPTDGPPATPGARYDHHDAFGSHVSPRAYLVWNPTEQWTVKGGISRGYLTPKLNQLHGGVNSVSGQGTQINVGNPDLQPEVSTSTEVGVHYDSL